jgi:hypothetical protein
VDRLSSSCIYTLLHSGRLREQADQGGRHKLTERNKPWRRGGQLWAEAERAGDRMAIVFAGADDTDPGLIYWGIIEDIMIDEENLSTICTYANLRPISPPKRLSALRLLNSGRQLSDADIGRTGYARLQASSSRSASETASNTQHNSLICIRTTQLILAL